MSQQTTPHFDFDLNPRFGAKNEKRWIVRRHCAELATGVKSCDPVAYYATKTSARLHAEKLNAEMTPPPEQTQAQLTWKDRALAATDGTKLGAILRRALDMSDGDMRPCFTGKATLTSDGYLTCNFIDREGCLHLGAFVGSLKDLVDNIRGLAKHLSLTDTEHNELADTVASWIIRS